MILPLPMLEGQGRREVVDVQVYLGVISLALLCLAQEVRETPPTYPLTTGIHQLLKVCC